MAYMNNENFIDDGFYTGYHFHSMLSNGVTNIDSVTRYAEYIAEAKKDGMKAFGFSEHGSVFEWYHKKTDIENAGMKYIHAEEFYLTETLDEKIRDNYHCVLIAKNYSGFLELNRLASASFNRSDNHYYYVPRISIDELFKTSDNIIITTACIGGVYGKGSQELRDRFTEFLSKNRERCFLEIGHHLDEKQVAYNRYMFDLSIATGIRLIAGTDTHSLNKDHELGRKVLQAGKNINFSDEDKWDLKFKTYEELVRSYEEQDAIPKAAYMEAIHNTNVMADMIEPFQLDKNTKYPKIYKDPVREYEAAIDRAIEEHPYALKRHGRQALMERVSEELDVYKATRSIDFMMLQKYLRDWERDQGIKCGPGRGSVSGSEIAYLLNITKMDSMKFNLNFFR